MAKKSANKQESSNSAIAEAGKTLVKEESEKAKERRKKISKNRDDKRYREIFKISKSKLLELTCKKISRSALEMMENRITSDFDGVVRDSSKYSAVILKKRRAPKTAYDAQLEKLRIKKSL